MDIFNDIKVRKNAERFQAFAISSCIGLGIVLYTGLSRLYSEIMGLIYSAMDYDTFIRLADSSIFQNSTYIVYALVCIALPFFCIYLITRKCFGAKLPFSKPKKGGGLLDATFIGLGMCVLGNRVSVLFTIFTESFFHSTPTGAPEDITSASQISFVGFLVSIVSTAIVPALVEEFAVRGVVMQPLRRFGDKFAVVISSLIFSIIHGNFQQIPFAFIVGLALGYVVIRTESIWAGVLLHFINNLWAVFTEYLSYLVPETIYILVYYTINAIICIVAVICAIRLYRKDVKAGMRSGALQSADCLISGFDKVVFVLVSPTFLLGVGDLLYGAFQNFVAV